MRGVLFSLLAVLLCVSPVFASGWLQIGERCVPGSTLDDPDGECVNQAYCYHQSGSDFGFCIENCAVTPMKDSSLMAGNNINRLCVECDDESLCDTRKQYICGAGSYGPISYSGYDCTKCPSYAGLEIGGFSAQIRTAPWDANTSITDCFILNGTTGTDETGTFSVSGNCYYSN